jgi:hypothetical protein
VHVPGRPDRTYRQALRDRPPLRAWEHDGYRVEILTADPYTDPDDGSPRHAITYRLSHRDRVIFSGDDIDCPAHHDPASDTALRQVVTLLTAADTAATPPQQRFLRDHADRLTAAITPPDPPYPPGTRITVTAPGRPAATGAITEHVPDRGGTALAYAWRPDTAELPGHPWHGHPQHALVTAAAHVTPTLAGPDRGLTGWTPDQPLAYRAVVQATGQDGRQHTGHVLRAVHTDTDLAYDIAPDPPGPPHRVPVDRIEPTTGTAWPSLDSLLAARAAAGIPLQEGEILTAAGHTADVTTGPDGPLLHRHQPTTTPRTPPQPAPTLEAEL